MLNGRLGSAAVGAAETKIIYTVPPNTVATVSINICNVNAVDCQIRLAISTDDVVSAEDYIECNETIPANKPLDRGGFACSAGERVIVWSSAPVSVRVHGFEEAAS